MKPLSRRMDCSFCGCEEHLLPCENVIAPGVRCPCNRVPVPGIWHPEDPQRSRINDLLDEFLLDL